MTTDGALGILVVAPTGRDACLIKNALHASGVQSEILKDVSSAIEAFRTRDVGALLIEEEALKPENIAYLSQALKEQPAWSSIPILLLTMGGKETPANRFRERQRLPLGNTTQLERPVRVATLLNSVQAALLARSRQYERKLSEAASQNEKLTLAGRMASSIAHEINNPLEAVANLLYLLDSTALTQEQRGYLDTAQQELARVSEMATHTLTFNRRRDLKGQASISALLDSVLVLYKGRIASSKITIERRYQNTPAFTCYPGELRQVFANLIGNAFDATRKGEGGRIVLHERAATHSKTGQQGVRITLADTGEGIDSQAKSHLFEAFQSTKGINGSGLGLWISKGIIDKHQGSIQFRSSTKPGKHGTVFSVFIPLERREQGE